MRASPRFAVFVQKRVRLISHRSLPPRISYRAAMSVSPPIEHAFPLLRSNADSAGVAALIVGTAITAWSGVLVRFLDIGPLAGGAWRMALAVPALAVWSKVAHSRRSGGGKLAPSAGLLILAGLAFALNIGAFHISLSGTTVANAGFIGAVGPIVTVVGGALFFRERARARVWLALGLALCGAWVMAGMLAPSRVGYGDAFALAASIAYGSYLLVIKRLRDSLDGVTATLWSAAVAAVVLAAAAWLHGETMIPTSTFGWMIVALLALLIHAMGQGLTSVALGRAPVGLVALVILAQPPFSALFAWFVLGEAMTPLQFAGGAIILAAVLLSGPPTASPSRRCAPSGTPRR
jgi:drug/metabolite transporter (DMT)-like permease